MIAHCSFTSKEVSISFSLQGQSSYEKFLKMLDDTKDEGIIELDENNNEIFESVLKLISK